jgi:3-oxoacyl-[acyl-carrier protein] reductase
VAGKLEGRVAIVTGSGQGVGRGIALVLASEGAKVVTNNRGPRSAAQAPAVEASDRAEREKFLALRGDAESSAGEIVRAGGEAIAFYGDIADYTTAGRLIEAALDAFGRIDILVNNAAGLGSGGLGATTESDWVHQTAAKLTGAFNCMRHAVPRMVEQGSGRVINVASDAWIGMPGLAAYSAANAGLVGLTKSVAKELLQSGVTVNAICPQAASPGHLEEFTAMKAKLAAAGMSIPEATLREVDAAHGPAEDMAPFVAYLATDEAAFITGAVFSVTANGRVALYSDPLPVAEIQHDGLPWTVDELSRVAPLQLLKDYVPLAQRGRW